MTTELTELFDETETPFVLEEPEWISMNDTATSIHGNLLPNALTLWNWLSSILVSDMLTSVTGGEETTKAIEMTRCQISDMGMIHLLDEVSQGLRDGISEGGWHYSEEMTDEIRGMLSEYWMERSEADDAAFYDAHHVEWELDEYLATHDVFALNADERLDAKALAKTMEGLRDTPPRDVVRILAKQGWDWSFIARSMRVTLDAPDEWAEVSWEDVAAIVGGMDYETHI